MQKVDRPTSLTKLNENCGLPDLFTDYQIRHLGNPSGLPEILLKIDPCIGNVQFNWPKLCQAFSVKFTLLFSMSAFIQSFHTSTRKNYAYLLSQHNKIIEF